MRFLRRPPALSSLLLACALAVSGERLHAQPGAVQAPSNRDAAAELVVPPLPEGTPQHLLDFIAGLKGGNVRPKTREQMMAYMRDVAAVSVQAADKILSQVQPGQKFHEEAATLKLESLMMLGRLGDEKAAADMAAYAQSLIDSPSPELAKEAQRLVLVAEAQQMFSSGKLDGGPALVQKLTAMLAADPNDAQTASLAMQLANAFEHLPGGQELAIVAYKSFGPVFAASTNEQVKSMGESFAGTLRRLSLLGHPMEVTGTLLSGQAFDQKSLAGKVVLVDFWATWCGPCVAEIPNMLEQYEKYHTKGFEIVGISLDEDREKLTSFVADKKIPWPILHDEPEGGEGNALASFYGITGIPQLILIGRDGNVITLNARGPKLAEELAKLFKDAG